MSVDITRDRFDSATVTIVVTCIAIGAVLNLPYQYVSKVHRYSQAPSLTEYSFHTFLFPHYEVMQGGFPFTYLVRQEDDLAAQPQFWSSAMLVTDLLIAALVTVLLGFITFRYRARWERFLQTLAVSRRRRVAFHVATVGLLAGILLAAISHILLSHAAEEKLANQLSVRGAVHRYTLIPKPLAKVFPGFVLERFGRIRGVMTWDRSPGAILKISRIPTLTSFTSHGRVLSASEMSSLRAHPWLNHLQLKGIEIEQPILSSIMQLRGLRSLELIQCSGLNRGMGDIEPLSRLVTLDLSNSDVRLAMLPASRWPKALKRLHLSRPRRGSDSLILSNLPALRALDVRRTDDSFNPDLVEIELSNLPRLEYLGIESLQKIALHIDSAPRLQAIGYSDPEIGLRVRGDQLVPASTWFESLRLRHLPSLRHLAFDGLDLQELSLQDLPNLGRLTIGRYGYRGGIILRPFDESAKPRIQAMIQALGESRGPADIDLSSLPLAGIDLSPLAQNDRIRRLCLRGCGVQNSQLSALSKLPGLLELDLQGCPITDEEACSLLCKGLPLRQLLVSSDEFERIEVRNQSKLRGFVATDSRRAKRVHISECPQLESELVLGDCVEQLRIRDGHSLLGLSVDGPLPAETELHGLRSLRFFAIGGPRADDQLCCNLWQCTDLDHLTVAYGRLSEASLKKIGRFSKLTVLALPGSQVSDEIVLHHWGGLNLLSDVDLSETAITSKSVPLLIRLKNLQKLAVNHCDLSTKDLRGLVSISQLIELEVSGIGLDADTLVGCLRRGMLDRLNLSYSFLDDAQLRVLAGPTANSLVFLGLRGCGLKDASVKRIADAHPRLAFDIADNPVSADLLAELRRRGRLLDQHDRDGFLRHLSDGDSERMADIRAEFDPVRGRIDSYQFVSSRQPAASL